EHPRPRGRYEEAEAGYKRCDEFDPGWACVVQTCRARFIDRRRGDLDRALEALGKALRTLEGWKPSDWLLGAYLYRGLTYLRRQRPDQALADLARLTDLAETWDVLEGFFVNADLSDRRLDLLLGRAGACLIKGGLDRALDDCDEAVPQAPRSAEARSLRAEVH